MRKLIELKRRMARIAEIEKVASTMATVAAAKLARTRRRAAGMREYAGRMRDILQRQQAFLDERGIDLASMSPYFAAAERVERVIVVHVAGDRGMCGNHNTVVNREGRHLVERLADEGREVALVCIGAKGERHLRARFEHGVLLGRTWPRAGVTPDLVESVHELLRDAFLSGEAQEVWCSHTRFLSPVVREPRILRLLPVEAEALTEGDAGGARERSGGRFPHHWSYEPDLLAVLPDLIEQLLLVQVEDLLLESYASEQAARMITMEEATERARKRLHECTVQMNRLRREFITTDLLGVLFGSRMRRSTESIESG